jgi:hypothetical protein
MNKFSEMKANLGILFRGDFRALEDLLERIAPILEETGIQIVHKQVSASKLWIKEGEDMNDRTKTL